MEEINYTDLITQKINTIEDSELKEAILKVLEERNYLANTIKIDPLTGAYNRRILENIREFSSAVVIDIDDFKTINDTYGHDIGDKVLQSVSHIMMRNCRTNDFVCRYGGDEFVIIFNGADDIITYQRMQKIASEIENLNIAPGLKITISVGISSSKEAYNIQETIKDADTALYYSKQNSKNQITLYEEPQPHKAL